MFLYLTYLLFTAHSAALWHIVVWEVTKNIQQFPFEIILSVTRNRIGKVKKGKKPKIKSGK